MKPQFSKQDYLNAGWNEQQLIDHEIKLMNEKADEMKYPIIKSNEAVTVLFTDRQTGYVLDYSGDSYEPHDYRNDWKEGAFSVVSGGWFNGKCFIVETDEEREFVLKLIFNHSGFIFARPSVESAKCFYFSDFKWVCSVTPMGSREPIKIPFDDMFEPVKPFNVNHVVCRADGLKWFAVNGLPEGRADLVDSTGDAVWFTRLAVEYDDFRLNEICIGDGIANSELDTEEKYNNVVDVFRLFGFKPSPVHDGYDRDNGLGLVVKSHGYSYTRRDNTSAYNLTYEQVMTIGRLKKLIMQSETVKPTTDQIKPEWREEHQVILDNSGEWRAIEPVWFNDNEVFFHDPRPAQPLCTPAPKTAMSANLLVATKYSGTYRVTRTAMLSVDENGVLQPHQPDRSDLKEVKLNIL